MSEQHVHATVTLVSRKSTAESSSHRVQAMGLHRRLHSAKAVPHGLALAARTRRCLPVDADALWNVLEDLQYAGKFEAEHLVCLF